MESNLSWVFNNIQPDQNGRGWKSFYPLEILVMSESDFNFIFPERKLQEERDKKLNELLNDYTYL